MFGLLKAHTGNNLQNEFITRDDKCHNKNTKEWEQLNFLKTNTDKIIIQSRWNNRNLHVQPSGKCVFANHNKPFWEQFDVEIDKEGFVYFISCHTGNVMQCDQHAWCDNKNRLAWKAWRIVIPENATIKSSWQLTTICLIAAGIVFFPICGAICSLCVPVAMST